MILCVAGDIHGRLDRMYSEVLAFEAALSVRFDWILHVGDHGVWPDASRIDGATRRHEGAGDFPAWPAEPQRSPANTEVESDDGHPTCPGCGGEVHPQEA